MVDVTIWYALLVVVNIAGYVLVHGHLMVLAGETILKYHILLCLYVYVFVGIIVTGSMRKNVKMPEINKL